MVTTGTSQLIPKQESKPATDPIGRNKLALVGILFSLFHLPITLLDVWHYLSENVQQGNTSR